MELFVDIYYRHHTCKLRVWFLSCASFECSVAVHIQSNRLTWIQWKCATTKNFVKTSFRTKLQCNINYVFDQFYVKWSGLKVHLSMHVRTIHPFLPARNYKAQKTDILQFQSYLWCFKLTKFSRVPCWYIEIWFIQFHKVMASFRKRYFIIA